MQYFFLHNFFSSNALDNAMNFYKEFKMPIDGIPDFY